MPRALLALALAFVLASPTLAAAQQTTWQRTSGTISTAGADCSVTTRCVNLVDTTRTGNGTIVLSGSFTGTAAFEGCLGTSSSDCTTSSTDWFALNVLPNGSTSFVNTATAAGQWSIGMAVSSVRVRASALSAGSMTVRMAVTSAAKAGGPGGGGGSGTVTHTSGALTAGACVIGNGTDDEKVDTSCTLDGSGNMVVATLETTGSAGPITIPAIAAPGAPAAGKMRLYEDSTSLNHCAVNASGTVTCMVTAALKQYKCVVIAGDPGAASLALANDNDSPSACTNDTGQDVTLTGFACLSDAGSPTVTPILTGGTGTSIVTGAVTCGTASWAAGTINGTPTLHSFTVGAPATCASTPCTADMNITVAGGTSKYIVFKLTGTIPNN